MSLQPIEPRRKGFTAQDRPIITLAATQKCFILNRLARELLGKFLLFSADESCIWVCSSDNYLDKSFTLPSMSKDRFTSKDLGDRFIETYGLVEGSQRFLINQEQTQESISGLKYYRLDRLA